MKATSGALPIGEGWTYEVKWDGMRALAFIEQQGLRVQSYNERDVTVSWPELAGLPDAVPATTARPRRRAGCHRRRRPTQLRAAPTAHARHRARRRSPPAPPRCRWPTWCSTCSTSTAPTSTTWRSRIGAGCCDQLLEPGPRWRVSPTYDDGTALLDAARARGLEGVVAKRLDSRYEPGRRTRAWLKVKVRHRQEMVVGRLAARRGQPHRANRRSARRLPRVARRRRPTAVRRSGRHRLQGRRADPARSALRRARHRRVPVRSAPASARRSSAGRAGCGPSSSPSSSSVSGPTTTACATQLPGAARRQSPPPR